MNRIKKALKIMKMSGKVLLKNKKLIIFPLLSFIMIITFFASITPFVLDAYNKVNIHKDELNVSDQLTQDKEKDTMIIYKAAKSSFNLIKINILVIFIFSIIFSYAVIYINSAFLSAVVDILHSKPSSIMTSLRNIWPYRWKILQWSFIASLVQLFFMILGVYTERLPIVGRYFSSILSFIGSLAWALATYFIIPVIIYEKASIKDSFKRSAELFKRTWGEQVTGSVVFGVITNIIIFGGIAFMIINVIIMILLFPNSNIAIEFEMLIVAAISLLLTATGVIACKILSSVFQGALYVYAAEGIIPDDFDATVLENAWKVK